MWPVGGRRVERLVQSQCIAPSLPKDEVGMIIPAILKSGGGQMPDCDGPDGLELPGLITAVGAISIHLPQQNK